MSWPLFCLFATSATALAVNAVTASNTLVQLAPISGTVCSATKMKLAVCAQRENQTSLEMEEVKTLQRCIRKRYDPIDLTMPPNQSCIMYFSKCVIEGASEDLRDVVLNILDCVINFDEIQDLLSSSTF